MHVHQFDLNGGTRFDRFRQNAGASVDVAAVNQVAGSDFGDVGIESGHHPIQGFDHRYLTAECGVHVGKFQADVAAADDRQPAGQPFEAHRLIAGEHGAAVGFDPGWHKGIGARGDDHVAARQHTIHTVDLTHAHLLGALQAPRAADDRDAGALERFGEVAADRGHQLIGVISNLLAFEAHRSSMNAKPFEVFGIGQFAHPAAGSQQCLGGNAAAVHAGAAHVAALDDRRAQAVLSGVLGSIEAAIAGTDHDHIKVEAAFAHRLPAQLAGILSCQAPCCRQRSSSRGAAATATFSDSTAGLCGMVTR